MSNFDNFDIHNSNNPVFFHPSMLKKDKDVSDPSQSQKSPLEDPAQEGLLTAEKLEKAREEGMQEIRSNRQFNAWFKASGGNAKEMTKLIDEQMAAEGCTLPPEFRQQGAQSVAYLLAGDCNPLLVIQLFASIQEQLALSYKKLVNDQMQDSIKLMDEIRKKQLQAAEKERSTSLTKALTSMVVSGGGVIAGQAWTIGSNAIKTKDVTKKLADARKRKDEEQSDILQSEKNKLSTSRFGGALQQMSTSMAAPIGEAVTADATRALRQQNSEIDRMKSIADQMMKRQEMNDNFANEMRKKFSDAIASIAAQNAQTLQSVSFRA